MLRLTQLGQVQLHSAPPLRVFVCCDRRPRNSDGLGASRQLPLSQRSAAHIGCPPRAAKADTVRLRRLPFL